MHVSLAHIFVHRVVRNVANATGAGALRIENLIVVASCGQQGIARLFSVFRCNRGIRRGCLEFGAVFFRSSKSVLER